MVRLKQIGGQDILVNHPSFNSSMVRLKLDNTIALRSIYESFNSSMVRLKLVRRKHVDGVNGMFQFLYGAIKT